MRFTVPQFIEHEAKIIGPLTFKQFIYVGTAGVICFILYFAIGQTNFLLFLLLSLASFSAAISLAFLKISGKSLPSIFFNLLRFNLTPKMYIWHKKDQAAAQVYKKEEYGKEKEKDEEDNGELPLKIAENSRLKKLHTKIETK